MTPSWSITTIKAEASVSALMACHHNPQLTIQACRQCDSYGKLWCCPPHDHDVEQKLAAYSRAIIIGTKITFDDAPCDDANRVMREAFADAHAAMLPQLYELERQHPGSFALSVRCTLCGDTPCTRRDNLPCRHPELMRPSLESLGFNVETIARDILHTPILWATSDTPLPPYQMLVTAVLYNE